LRTMGIYLIHYIFSLFFEILPVSGKMESSKRKCELEKYLLVFSQTFCIFV